MKKANQELEYGTYNHLASLNVILINFQITFLIGIQEKEQTPNKNAKSGRFSI